MYAWLWRALPGPLWFRVALLSLVVVLLLAALFEVIFPAVAPHLPFNDATLHT